MLETQSGTTPDVRPAGRPADQQPWASNSLASQSESPPTAPYAGKSSAPDASQSDSIGGQARADFVHTMQTMQTFQTLQDHRK